MEKEINIDYEKLEIHIENLKKILNQLEEPSFDKVNFWLNGVMGSGNVHDYLVPFCRNTTKYYDAVSLLIKNTVCYLEKVKEVKKQDDIIANKL